MTYYPVSRDAVNISQYLRLLEQSIRYEMQVVRHYCVGEDQEARRLAGLGESVAKNLFQLVLLKHWKSFVGDRCKIEKRVIFGYLHKQGCEAQPREILGHTGRKGKTFPHSTWAEPKRAFPPGVWALP